MNSKTKARRETKQERFSPDAPRSGKEMGIIPRDHYLDLAWQTKAGKCGNVGTAMRTHTHTFTHKTKNIVSVHQSGSFILKRRAKH